MVAQRVNYHSCNDLILFALLVEMHLPLPISCRLCAVWTEQHCLFISLSGDASKGFLNVVEDSTMSCAAKASARARSMKFLINDIAPKAVDR